MDRCVVIQPFDNGKFDKRYKDVFAPAIEKAELDPYRVDQDARTTIPIDDVCRAIRECRACLADISTDNPNVWFELGFAIATEKPVVLVCSTDRTSYPFDIQHRKIIQYETDSTSDFERLQSQITTDLRARIDNESDLKRLARITADVPAGGLEHHEVVGLVVIAQNYDTPTVHARMIGSAMEHLGYNELATRLALEMLMNRAFIAREECEGEWGARDHVYGVTEQGMKWLIENRTRLQLKTKERGKLHELPTDGNDDVPF